MTEFYMLIQVLKKRLSKFLIISGLLWLGFADTGYATTYTYIGANNGSWTTTTNWSGGTHYPGFAAGDAAIINSSVNININSAVANSISTLTINTGFTATVTISSGLTLALTGTLTVGGGSAAYFTLTGAGAATLSGITFGYQSTFTIGTSPVSTTNVTLNSGSTMSMTNNNNVFTNYGVFTINSSTLTLSGGPTTFTNAGTVNLNPGSTLTVSNNNSFITNTGTFTASGTVLSPTTINLNSSAGNSGINNTSPGIFTATSTTLSFIAGSGNTINNTGTFTATLCPITLGGGPSQFKNTGGSFTAEGCTITLAQSSYISNTGTCKLEASGATATTVNFGYAAYITNTAGTFSAGTSGSQCILNVSSQNAYVSNSGAGTNFNLGSTSIIYITGYTSYISNTATGTGAFTLQSDASGSAAIGALASTAYTTGTFNVERYFQGGATKSGTRWIYRNYRIISSPLNTGTQIVSGSGNYYIYGLNYIVGATAGQTTGANSTTNAFVMGAAGGSSTAGNPSLFLYRESITPSNLTFTSGNFIGITSITTASAMHTSDGATTTTIPAGNGVFFFYRGNASNFTSRTTSPYIAPENTTLTATGSLNQQNVLVKNWYSTSSANLGYTGVGAGTNSAVRGFNMVGNPYACSIDWNTAFSNTGITLTHINPTIWVFNPFTNQYDTYITTSSSTGTSNGGGTDGSGFATNIIASGQGFFVQANAANPALTFTEAAKSPTSQVAGSYLLMGTPVAQNASQQLLRLRMVSDSLNYDDITISFNSAASSAYNGAEDAEYLPGVNAAEGFSSLSTDSIPVQLSINSLPLPKKSPQVIRLNVTASASGPFTFQRTELDAIPQIYQVWLMDKYKKDSLDMRNNSSYAFAIDLTDTASFGSNRFSIVIRQNPALGVRLLDFTATKATGGAQVVWKTENEQNYTNFTIERSINNGASFDVLDGMVSNALGTYSFLDKDPKANDQYRLKIEDLNGTITYSNVVTLDYSGANNSLASNINIYPNPATNYINLAITPNNNLSSNLSALQALSSTPGLVNSKASSQSYNIKIIGITGTIIKTAISSMPDWHDNVSNLTPGTYIIQVTNNNDNSLVGKSTFVKL